MTDRRPAAALTHALLALVCAGAVGACRDGAPRSGGTSDGGAAPLVSAPAPADAAAPLHEGPWGTLRAVRILIEPPVAFTKNTCPEEPAPWRFSGASRDDVQRLWAQAGLPEALSAALMTA